MPKNKVKRLPRNIKTIDDLLTADDVNSAIELLIASKVGVKKLIIVCLSGDSYTTICTDNITNAEIVFYAEQLKHDLFSKNESDEEEV
jgi:hypothetical protein